MTYCCVNCFSDFRLKEIIIKKGQKSRCFFCQSRNVVCISPELLNEILSPLFNLYSAAEQEGVNADRIWNQIQNDWGIFSIHLTSEIREALLRSIITDTSSPLWDTLVYIKEKYDGKYEEKMHLWETFKLEIKENNRFFPRDNKKIDEENLEILFQNIEYVINPGDLFYRARQCQKNVRLKPREMGKPPRNFTKNGRANPIGIPYLYLASDQYTALAELKPTMKDYITIGRFKATEELRLIDLREISPFQFYKSEDFDSLVPDIPYLRGLGRDLSQPISPKDTDVEYISTQYLCEFIKNKGWDGVIYKSYLGEGDNITLFNDTKLRCMSTKLHQINKVKWEHAHLGEF